MPYIHDGSLPLDAAVVVTAAAVVVGTGAADVVGATQTDVVVSTQAEVVVSTQTELVVSTHDEDSVGATQLDEGVARIDDVSIGTELPRLPTTLVAEETTLDKISTVVVRADVAKEAEVAAELVEKSDTDVAMDVLLAGVQRLPRLRLRLGLATTSGTLTSVGSSS